MDSKDRTNLLNVEETVIGRQEYPLYCNENKQYGTIPENAVSVSNQSNGRDSVTRRKDKQAGSRIQESFKPMLDSSDKYKKKKRLQQGAIVAGILILCAVVAFGGATLAIHVLDDNNDGGTQIESLGTESGYFLRKAGEIVKAVCAPDANKTQKVFPSLDYAVFGYNILSAYPLAFGHDPGFTHPIFMVTYKENKKTADCSYSVPDGLDVIRDVSCATTFTSETIKTSQQFNKAISHSAGASFGGFGFKFSANGEYKSDHSQIASGENVFILSQAKCQQFFSQVNEFNPPPFHPTFIGWLQKLQNSTDKRDFIEFIIYYGTHFISETAFGARYINLYSMTTKSYQEMTSKHINVNVQASYSGLFFHVGAHYSFSEDEKKSMSYFSSQTTTKTITMGTPPPVDLNTTKWANQAFNTPVPISNKLMPIDQLFTDKFMGHLPSGFQINYQNIRRKLLHVMTIEYPKEIYDRSTNIQCRSVNAAFKLPEDFCFQQDIMQMTSMQSGYECNSNCLESPDCIGATFNGQAQCHLLYRLSYKDKDGMRLANRSSKCNSFLFPYRLSSNYGRSYQPEWMWLKGVTVNSATVTTLTQQPSQCQETCVRNPTCVAIMIQGINKCATFTQEKIETAVLKKSQSINDSLGFVKVC